MRSFSGLYFFLRIAACLCMLLSHLIEQLLYINQWITLGTLLFFATLTVAIAKPYCKAYMNYWDIAILSNLAILFYVLSSGSRELATTSKNTTNHPCFWLLYRVKAMTCVKYT